MANVCATYRIKNLVNGNLYVGSSKNIYRRKNAHFGKLEAQIHENRHLQNAYNKYGKDAFEFTILKHTDPNSLLQAEQELLDEHFGKDYCYNICGTAGSPAVAGRIKTADHRRKLSESVQRHFDTHPEHKARLSELRMGTTISAEVRAKMRQSKKRGSDHHNSRLNEEQAQEIRQKYVPRQYSFGRLAKEYGVDRKTIIRIIQNKTWTHLKVQ